MLRGENWKMSFRESGCRCNTGLGDVVEEKVQSVGLREMVLKRGKARDGYRREDAEAVRRKKEKGYLVPAVSQYVIRNHLFVIHLEVPLQSHDPTFAPGDSKLENCSQVFAN